MPRVTILLPIFNTAEFLGETLESLKAQTFRDFEILLINDGSTDHWAEVVERSGVKNIRVVEQENMGLVGTLNRGVQLIDSELIARADGDDIYFPNRLEAQVDLLDFAKLDATAPRVMNIDERGKPINLSPEALEFYKQDSTSFPPKEPYLQHPFMLLKRAVLEKMPFRNAHLSEDADLCWRMVEEFRVHVSSDVLGKYRIHTASVSSGSIGKGRVQAFYAALAALNASRRRNGDVEIAYQGSLEEAVRRARSLVELALPYRSELTPKERSWLLAASSAKLIDLGTWRNFRLTEADLKEARSNFKSYKVKDHEQRLRLRAMIETVRRRMDNKTWGEVAATPNWVEVLWNRRNLF